jgi:hypothetical protein
VFLHDDSKGSSEARVCEVDESYSPNLADYTPAGSTSDSPLEAVALLKTGISWSRVCTLAWMGPNLACASSRIHRWVRGTSAWLELCPSEDQAALPDYP